MALFKILRGPSSELTKLPINDGWCYFTPDTGLFHIDYNGQRVPLNSKNALNASNATSAIMTEGIIDQNSGDVIKLWYGTSEQYNALAEKDNDTIYMLSDGESSSINAIDITYDNSISKLSATDIQDAIDEIATTAGKAGYVLETNKGLQQKFWRGTKEEYDALGTKDEDTMYIILDEDGENVIESGADAEDIIYNNTTSGLIATNVQNAIDELNHNIKNIPTPDVSEQITEHNEDPDAHINIVLITPEDIDTICSVTTNINIATMDEGVF